MKVDVDRLTVEVDESGRIVDVATRSRPEHPFLVAVDVGACRVDGVDIAWSAREVSADADEIGIHLSAGDQPGDQAGGLDLRVRHSFTTGWATRLLIVNTSAASRAVERLQLIARPAPGQRVCALATGSRLCWAAQPSDGMGALLAARLTTGAVTRVTEEGFELGPLRLAPGQRYVTQLRWELFATPRSVVAGPGRDVLLTRTTYEVGEAVPLPEDPDAALVTPPGVIVEHLEEAEQVGREVAADEPGRYRIELRSADGDLRLDLSWVPPLTEQLGAWAATLLAGPRTPAGVVTLTELPAAIVVQAAHGSGLLDDADAAADALDRLTAQLLDRVPSEPPIDPLEVLYLLGEHGRTGDDDVLELALSRQAALLGQEGSPGPGLGLAVLRTVLAGVDAHERVAPLVRRALERATVAADGFTSVPSAAEVELLLAVRPLLPDDHPAQQRLVIGVRRLGAAIGAGLPGRLVPLPPVTEQAHLVAVLRMLPEDGVPGVTRSWGASPSLLAQRLTLELLDRLTDAEPGAGPGTEIGPAAAWLALVQRHA